MTVLNVNKVWRLMYQQRPYFSVEAVRSCILVPTCLLYSAGFVTTKVVTFTTIINFHEYPLCLSK